MSVEESKSINLRWIQAFNERDWATEAAYRTPDFVAYMSGSPEPLHNEGGKAFMAQFTGALPHSQISGGASVAERDVVASRWTITGTHRGMFQGVPATG